MVDIVEDGRTIVVGRTELIYQKYCTAIYKAQQKVLFCSARRYKKTQQCMKTAVFVCVGHPSTNSVA